MDDSISQADRTADLIGDGSQPYALPTLKIKHDRFKRIDATTLVKLIDGHFSDTVQSFTIIDCRYPYEYQGGHIINSLNIHTGQDLIKLFIDQKEQASRAAAAAAAAVATAAATATSVVAPSTCTTGLINHNNNNGLTSNNNNNNTLNNHHHHHDNHHQMKRQIIIFHCEFSSERGPKLMRLLREKDRQINKYPELLHPELYLLEGGYREFFRKYKEYCIPQAYRPMKARSHKDELKNYRKRRKLASLSSSYHQPRKENRLPDISFDG